MENKELTIEKLNELYSSAEECDKKLFAEMRSNILLESGDHYKKISENLDRGLQHQGVSKSQRIRLTKNHTQKATNDIKDIILNQASSFMPVAANDTETSDVKSAELARSVWEDGKRKNRWDDFVQRECNSFVTVGEVCAKIYFDPSLGKIKSYPQKTAEDGTPIYMYEGMETFDETDEFGQPLEPAADLENPEFTGQLLIEKIYAFNLLRCPSANTMKDSPYLIHRKMVDTERIISMFANTGDKEFDDDLKAKITESGDKTYKIFDSNSASFKESKGQAMLREFFFRKCQKYPKGYFYIATDNTILAKGEIPFGEHGDIAFPIKHDGYDLIETCPRFSGPIRHIRPYQAEINRAASSIAETQVTLGSDKMFTFSGSTVSKGVDLPGIRHIQVSGREPIVMPGRSGDQYTGYLKDQIQEMRFVLSLPADNLSPAAQTMDPKAELFKSAKLKQKFSRPALRFENYCKEIVESYLFLATKYLDDDEVIRAVGRKEAVNISEFKNVDIFDYRIQVEAVSGDFDSMWGKSLELETIAQYFGKDLPDHVKAATIKSFPHLNKDPIFKNLLVEHEAPTNMLLALDRGEDHIPNKYDNAQEMLKYLYLRTREADFKMLSADIQMKYADTIAEYESIQAKQTQEIINQQKGVIPSGGSLTKCDIYVTEPKTNGGVKTVRATLPSQSLEWLIKQLEKQGIAQERLMEMGAVQGALDVGARLDMSPQTGQPPMPVMPPMIPNI